MTCKQTLHHKPLNLKNSHTHEHSPCNSKPNLHRHENAHNHAHLGHSHAVSANTNKKMLKICIFITICAMIFQFIYSLITNSLALLSDTLHMFSHAFALSLSFFCG